MTTKQLPLSAFMTTRVSLVFLQAFKCFAFGGGGVFMLGQVGAM
jgi:hypothetical protein